MVRKFLLIFTLLTTSCYGDIYEKSCVSCHKKLPVGLDKLFFRYLLKYSSKKDMLKNLKQYLIYPSVETTVMPESFIDRFGIKSKTTLKPKEIDEALEVYWQKYKVFGRLK
ncbi:MAG: hypothetical protein U9Q04_06930 [Campylobacterota bacterium]|nr:hypothetical protein [Campylobacterota bacterium]